MSEARERWIRVYPDRRWPREWTYQCRICGHTPARLDLTWTNSGAAADAGCRHLFVYHDNQDVTPTQ